MLRSAVNLITISDNAQLASLLVLLASHVTFCYRFALMLVLFAISEDDIVVTVTTDFISSRVDHSVSNKLMIHDTILAKSINDNIIKFFILTFK